MLKLNHTFITILAFLFSILSPLNADNIFRNYDKVIVDLKEPIFKNGVLSTSKGGVIYNDDIRIQAQKIEYHKKHDGNLEITKVEASGDVIVDLKGRIFIGDYIEYDFTTRTGKIFNATTQLDIWYIKGSEIDLHSDDSIVIKKAILSTSHNFNNEWQIGASNIRIKNNRMISTKNINLKFFKIPIFWLPAFKTSVDNLFETPLKINFKWGGGQGPRANIRYRILTLDNWQAFGILDCSIKRGWGTGIDTIYENEKHKTNFETRNYVAYDKKENEFRYHFDGVFRKNNIFDEKTNLLFQYDRLSDAEMTTNYHSKEFDLKTAGRTELSIWHNEEDWSLNFFSRLHINSFQTIKQELPTIEFSLKPFQFSRYKIISENTLKASYLNLKYSKDLNTSFENFESIKLSTENNLYRNFKIYEHFNLTPDIGFIGVYYGNSPYDVSKTAAAIKGTVNIKTQLSKKYYNKYIHTSKPYIEYKTISNLSTSTGEHYIFDAADGIDKLNQLSIGLKNNILRQYADQQHRDLALDIYATSFFNAHSVSKRIPYLNADINWTALKNIECYSKVIWNFNYNIIDHFNVGIGWTHDEDLAAGLEYRHRSKYCWRKADRTNYILEMIRSEDDLLSNLSDQNDTFLTRIFYRLDTNWSTTFRSRHGWNRPINKKFNEYQLDVATVVKGNWNLRVSYLHREEEQRISARITLPQSKPALTNQNIKRGSL